jgi:hypothetical protein
MGWIKLIVVSAVGVYSYRSVSRVNQLVRQVGVPSHSLLGKYNSQGGHGLKKAFKEKKNLLLWYILDILKFRSIMIYL